MVDPQHRNTPNNGETLERGQSLVSQNGLFRLTMQQDGNVVLYGPTADTRRGPNGTAMWSSETHGSDSRRLEIEFGQLKTESDKSNDAELYKNKDGWSAPIPGISTGTFGFGSKITEISCSTTWSTTSLSGAAIPVDSATKVLGEDVFEATVQQAQQLRPEFEELQPLMRNLVQDQLPRTGPTDSRWQELSPAEREVALLAAAGWTNSAIAARRGNSTRTVDAQITTVFRKLLITNRFDIIGHIPEEFRYRIASESQRRPARSRPRR